MDKTISSNKGAFYEEYEGLHEPPSSYMAELIDSFQKIECSVKIYPDNDNPSMLVKRGWGRIYLRLLTNPIHLGQLKLEIHDAISGFSDLFKMKTVKKEGRKKSRSIGRYIILLLMLASSLALMITAIALELTTNFIQDNILAVVITCSIIAVIYVSYLIWVLVTDRIRKKSQAGFMKTIIACSTEILANIEQDRKSQELVCWNCYRKIPSEIDICPNCQEKVSR